MAMNLDKVLVSYNHRTNVSLGILLRKVVGRYDVRNYGVKHFLEMSSHNTCVHHPFNVIVAMIKDNAVGHLKFRREYEGNVRRVEEKTALVGSPPESYTTWRHGSTMSKQDN